MPKSRFSYFLSVFVILLLAFYSSDVFSQLYYPIVVTGFVKKEKGNLLDAVITLYRRKSNPDTVITAPEGEFTLLLKFDYDYTIEISKQGYVSKNIIFCTRNVPEKDKKYLHEFEFEISLFQEMEGVDLSVLKKPVTKVIYDEKKGYFDYDQDYTQTMQLLFFKSISKQLDQVIKKLRAKMLERERSLDDIKELKKQAEDQANKMIEQATQKADSILTIATLKSETRKLITIYDTVTKRNEVRTAEKEKITVLPEFKLKTIKEIDDLVKDTLQLIKKKQEIKKAKKQIESDKNKAKTTIDSLIINERQAKINTEEFKILLAEKQRENIKKQNEIQSCSMKNQKLILICSTVGILFVLLLLLFIFKIWRQNKKFKLLKSQNQYVK